MKKNNHSFEADLSKLSNIVEQVEDAQTPLDTAIALYKEGLALSAKCGETLTHYEKEVQALQKDANGAFLLTPFGEGTQ